MTRTIRAIRRSIRAALTAGRALVTAARGHRFTLLVALYRAIDTAATVRIAYTDSKGVASERDITPHRLDPTAAGNITCRAYDWRDREDTTFRADRITLNAEENPVTSVSASRPLRRATVADIVKRLTGTGYDETAISALGWGMGPAQHGIVDAVAEAEAAGLVTVRTWRGKRFARIAPKPSVQVGPYTVTLLDTPGEHFAYGVDVHRPTTEDEAFIYGGPEGAPTLACQWGGHDQDEAIAAYLDLIAEYKAIAEKAALTEAA